ncbi:hypothetical protein ACFYMW_35755 [Streptomyces sp. NPDC006692]|uniref:hypothetical protein n=1 Tax=unclassified Streptomyces TaxID=2593676 RepID=UPI003434CE33
MTDTTGPKLTKNTRAFVTPGAPFDTTEDVTGHDFEAHGVTLFVHTMLSLPLSGGGMRRRWVVRYAETTTTTKAGTFLVLRADNATSRTEAVAVALRRIKVQQEAEAAPAPRTAAEQAEEQACERDRKAEERTRPTSAQVYVSPLSGRATLHLIGADGGQNHEPIKLDGSHRSPQDAGADAAITALGKAGFRCAPGAYWRQHATRRDTAVLAIVPTRAYLAYNERRFGPRPVVPAIADTTIKARTQRGWWDVITADGERYALTWSPQITGDRWTLWGGPQYTQLIRSGSQDKVLFVLKHPAHARAACAQD